LDLDFLFLFFPFGLWQSNHIPKNIHGHSGNIHQIIQHPNKRKWRTTGGGSGGCESIERLDASFLILNKVKLKVFLSDRQKYSKGREVSSSLIQCTANV
jgi:hypothetical protein